MSSKVVEQLMKLGQQTGALDAGDEFYLENQVRALVGDDLDNESDTSDLLEDLVQIAINNQKMEDTITNREILASQLMNLITPRPSAINRQFQALKKTQGPQAAIAYFYQLCRLDNDIQTKAIAKNIEYIASGLEITINLSKPEKDPKAIAKAATQSANSYPKCQLCLENEGYLGRVGYPARSNHRVVQIEVNHEPWGFQYSPYAYFDEHAIFIDKIHRPMVINQQTFANLMEILDQFPGYFVGSNADLPIVGGSMLSHEHYQGGKHVFPMMKQGLTQTFELGDYPDVTAGVVDWPMTVIRLQSSQTTQLVEAANLIHNRWKNYSDESLNIRSEVNGVSHHTVTPIAYKNGDEYVLDIVLRDNQTSSEFPDGIFHPHPDVQHIKKENIGLIEVMGRAIFPPRLVSEMDEVKKYWLNQDNTMADYHRAWAASIKANVQINADNVDEVLQMALGDAFRRVLEDAGVYKGDTAGRNGLQKFIGELC